MDNDFSNYHMIFIELDLQEKNGEIKQDQSWSIIGKQHVTITEAAKNDGEWILS